MPNIFLTSKCNLNCTYCFASEFVNKACSEFTCEDFLKIVQLIKNDGFLELGLIGGEPTLYPYLKDILNVLKEEKQFEKYTLFTNGLEIEDFIDQAVVNNLEEVKIIHGKGLKILERRTDLFSCDITRNGRGLQVETHGLSKSKEHMG